MSRRAEDGLLLLGKPAGPTSHDVVRQVRRALGCARAGHTGTLDPAATGLLPIVVGRATRLSRFVPASPKVYVGRIQLGVRTATDDLTGEVVFRHEGPLPPPERVLAAAAALRGLSLQVPPAFSARRVGGRRMHELARAGRIVSAPPSEVDVVRLDLAPAELPALWEFVAEVSAGTYIRALARDLGAALGCGASLAALARVRIGPLSIEDAVPCRSPLDGDLLRSRLIPLERMPLVPPRLDLSPSEARRFALGGRLPSPIPAGWFSVYAEDGSLLGVGEAGAGELRPRVVLAGPA